MRFKINTWCYFYSVVFESLKSSNFLGCTVAKEPCGIHKVFRCHSPHPLLFSFLPASLNLATSLCFYLVSGSEQTDEVFFFILWAIFRGWFLGDTDIWRKTKIESDRWKILLSQRIYELQPGISANFSRIMEMIWIMINRIDWNFVVDSLVL